MQMGGIPEDPLPDAIFMWVDLACLLSVQPSIRLPFQAD